MALTKRWKKIKKRCSFSSSDRLVRSKSFTEQDTIKKDQVEAGFSSPRSNCNGINILSSNLISSLRLLNAPLCLG